MLLRRSRVTQGFESATCTPSTAPGTHRGPREVDYGQAAQVPRDVLELVHHRSPYQRGVKGVMELERGSAHTRWSKLGLAGIQCTLAAHFSAPRNRMGHPQGLVPRQKLRSP